MSNVPDDWHSYWETCSRCGNRYHASEGGCECEYYCNCGEELEDGRCPECDPTCEECGLDADPLVEKDGRTLCGPCADQEDEE